MAEGSAPFAVSRFGRTMRRDAWWLQPLLTTTGGLKNLLAVSEAVTRSALERKESRGAHFREDFPTRTRSGAR
jgi:succinate dehydrogenase/fumarate reductase flavoprotein subunit